MSTKAAAQIIAEYERAIKSDDAPALPCVSPDVGGSTAGSCCGGGVVVVAVLCVAKGALVTARVSAQAAASSPVRAGGFVAASTASFVVAGLALEYGIRLYGAIRVRAEPFLRARAPEACKFLFPTSPKKDVDLEAAVESVAVSPKSDSPTKRTPKTPAPQPLGQDARRGGPVTIGHREPHRADAGSRSGFASRRKRAASCSAAIRARTSSACDRGAGP
ncbi:ATP-dependent 5'-3' RNA helicase [Aureococcus anophagefferens]|nr:ATP-dependent 5'-3' RNA helicase [Aureococcus anophagefferens]